MNVNITGIYDNTVIVDSNLFEDVKLLQTGLSSLSDTLYNVFEGLSNQYANLTTFTAFYIDGHQIILMIILLIIQHQQLYQQKLMINLN